MFDPLTETNPSWDEEIRRDVIEECRKHGGALHVYVDRASPEGHVYVKCPTIASAVASVNALHGRWFAALSSSHRTGKRRKKDSLPATMTFKDFTRADDDIVSCAEATDDEILRQVVPEPESGSDDDNDDARSRRWRRSPTR
ncbi:hypothetical protein HPB51_028453 [Rhipicephalus microplus]|uniref:Uncharacterized protein n=1 Tax=Rhipicephalus microplus TaxID=6941 RepID=A0A9J6CXA0_RHIMP|nr:hypothetical protein HPB51_028453 [Rhipicephalus microplus]